MTACVNKVLANSGLSVSLDNLMLISKALQFHVRQILESSVAQSKRKSNKSAQVHVTSLKRTFTQVKSGNAAAQDHLNDKVILKWGPDVVGALKLEEHELTAFIQSKRHKEEESLLAEVRSQYLANSRKGVISSAPSAEHDWINEVGSTVHNCFV